MAQTIRMAPGTWGEGRPAVFLKGRTRPEAAGLRHIWLDCALERSPAEYGLAMLASSGKSDGEAETGVERDFPRGPARGMAFIRCAHVPVASRKDFSF